MLAQLKVARGRLAAVRALVLASSPEEVDRCIPLLHEAIACLQSAELADQKKAEPADQQKAELARELGALRFELGVVSRLAGRGAEFYQGWTKVLAAGAAGYTATGEPAPLVAARSVSVEG